MERLEIPKTDAELQARLNALREKAAAQMALDPSNVPEWAEGSTAQSDCGRCRGLGYVRTNPNDPPPPRYEPCGCLRAHMPARGVPYEFQAVTLKDYAERDGQKAAIAKAGEFVNGGRRDLFLFGGVGAGKTRLSCAVANSLHQAGADVLFARVPYLLHQLQPGHDKADLERQIETVSVLVLDDIGAERDQATDYTRRTLLMLYEARHDGGRRTVFTSNKSVQELAEMQQDDRLSSRIAGRADVVRLTTPDQRLLRRVK